MTLAENRRDSHLAPGGSVRSSSPTPSHRSARSALTLRSNDSPSAPSSHDEYVLPSPVTATRLIKIEVHRKLTWWDVTALIINKMIGTGIFTGPPTILLYTGNKRIALGFWAVGFLYTLLSMTVYLEYSRKLPYTGGELVYLDEVLPRPILFSYTCYALYFICLYTTATNSMQFARQVIMASTNSTDISDVRVLKLIAVVITTVICLLLYFSTATGRRMNRYLAWLKIGLMIAVFMAGAVTAGRNQTSVMNKDVSRTFKLAQSNSATALLNVLFSFQGWENATLVADEIPDYRTLRKGFIRGVLIVGTIYMLINIVYCYAIPWGPNGTLETQYVPLFFGNSERARQAWAVLTALSAVGSMISVTYTCVRVKQIIGWTNILPWSTFWRSTAPVRSKEPRDAFEMQNLLSRTSNDNGQAVRRTGAPQGGIALHWIACIFYISVSSAIYIRREQSPDMDADALKKLEQEKQSAILEAISFSGLLNTYAHSCMAVVVGLGFLLLRKRQYKLKEARGWNPGDTPWYLAKLSVQYLLGFLYASGSIVILVLSAIGPYKNSNGSARVVKGWFYPVITFSFLALSMVYYCIFLASETSNSVSIAGVHLKRQRHGVDDNQNITRQCDSCVDHDPGEEHRHANNGYVYFNELNFRQKDKGRNLLYWLFGGPKERHHLDLHLDEYVDEAKEGIHKVLRGIWTGGQRLLPFKRR
jgi:hypothetical protein